MSIRRAFPHRLRACALALGFGVIAGIAHAEQEPPWLLDSGIAAFASVPESTYPQPVPAPSVLPDAPQRSAFSPIQLVLDLANHLRDIRYKRGGREPSTGFDCSGFVRYVFHKGIGADLPNTSAAQFRAGQKINRSDLRRGDLVFFRTAGKRISHVGIYVGDGEFIHAPSTGKRVSVSRLAEPYWSRRFAGAKRLDALAEHAPAHPHDQG